MDGRRLRSTDRGTNRLAKVFKRLVFIPLVQALGYQLMALQYSGSGNAEYYISRLQEVAETNA